MGICGSTAVSPASIVSDSVPTDAFAKLAEEGPEMWFHAAWQHKCKTPEDAVTGLRRMFYKVSEMKIFDQKPNASKTKPTVVTFGPGRDEIEKDQVVAISTAVGNKYVTSKERVTALQHIKGQSFLCSIAAGRGAVVDGFYRLEAKVAGQRISFDFYKVQSFNSALRAMLPQGTTRQMYEKEGRNRALRSAALMKHHLLDALSIGPQGQQKKRAMATRSENNVKIGGIKKSESMVENPKQLLFQRSTGGNEGQLAIKGVDRSDSLVENKKQMMLQKTQGANGTAIQGIKRTASMEGVESY